MAELRTRAGLVPAEREIPYDITTEKAEEFLQKKIDGVVNMMRKNGIEQDDVEIHLLSVKVSKKFVPFMVCLSKSVLENSKNRKNNVEELDIFNPEEGTRGARLKKNLFDLLNCFTYNKDDEKAFFNPSWRQGLGVSLKMSHMLKANRVPKVQAMNKGRNEYVICFIDPIRLFSDMLANLDDKNDKFNTYINKCDQIKNGNYKYEVYRAPRVNGKKDKKDKNFEERLFIELSQRMG